MMQPFWHPPPFLGMRDNAEIEWMGGIAGVRIMDHRDGAHGTIIREFGGDVVSVLMDDGDVCYMSRGMGRFSAARNLL